MSRPKPVGAPPCPRPDHTPALGFEVVCDGRYGREPSRQRYRCTDARTGEFHRFTPPLPRQDTPGGICSACDTQVAAHAGPVVSRRYGHRLHAVADALVAVGRGMSYALASQRARVAAGRDLLTGGGAGQLVAEWVDSWAQVVIDGVGGAGPVETLLLDSTDFNWTNRRTRQRRREFAVLAAYGYLTDGHRRLLAARASPTATAQDWLDVLADLRLHGPPVTVVADDDAAIQAAVRRMWPAASPGAPFLFACEHHLRERARKALAKDKADAPRGRWGRRLDTAFRRPEGWEEFRDACAPLGAAAAWVKANDAQITAQVARRHLLPAHRSTAGVDAAIGKLRDMFEARSFSLRNSKRTNLLLGLARLHLAGLDDAATYHHLLRSYAEANQGNAPARQRTNRDRRDPVTGAIIPSLR